MPTSLGPPDGRGEMLSSTTSIRCHVWISTPATCALSLAVVDEGTFTDAAITLRTSQASVSRSVQRLETVVGPPSARAIHPARRRSPRPASRVLAHARRVLSAVDRLAEAVAADDGRLVVGYAWAALGEHTVSVQRGWSRDHGAELELVHTNTPTAGLVEGRCDTAIVRIAPSRDPRLASTIVGEERRVRRPRRGPPLAARHSLQPRGPRRRDDRGRRGHRHDVVPTCGPTVPHRASATPPASTSG